jgi:hypothetical protein
MISLKTSWKKRKITGNCSGRCWSFRFAMQSIREIFELELKTPLEDLLNAREKEQ